MNAPSDGYDVDRLTNHKAYEDNSMSAAVMTEPMAGALPRFKANIAGILYLANILAFVPAAYVHSRFVAGGEAAASATNALAHDSLFRLGFTFDLIAVASYVAVTVLFFDLFKPVSRTLSLLAAYVSLTGCAATAVSCLFHLASLAVLRGAQYLPSLAIEPLQAVAFLFLKLRSQTANIGIVFFGFYCLLIGYLIFRSNFLPRALGVLMAIAGLGWLTYLSPPLARDLAAFTSLITGLVGEGSLMLWLLVIGVNAQRRNAAALASPEQI